MDTKEKALVSKEKRKKQLKGLFWFFFIGLVWTFISEDAGIIQFSDTPYFFRVLSVGFFGDIAFLFSSWLLGEIAWIACKIFKKDLMSDSQIFRIIIALLSFALIILIFLGLCAAYNMYAEASIFAGFFVAAAGFDLIIRCILLLKHHLDYRNAIKALLEEA